MRHTPCNQHTYAGYVRPEHPRAYITQPIHFSTYAHTHIPYVDSLLTSGSVVQVSCSPNCARTRQAGQPGKGQARVCREGRIHFCSLYKYVMPSFFCLPLTADTTSSVLQVWLYNFEHKFKGFKSVNFRNRVCLFYS